MKDMKNQSRINLNEPEVQGVKTFNLKSVEGIIERVKDYINKTSHLEEDVEETEEKILKSTFIEKADRR